jgi:hypothetical protein
MADIRPDPSDVKKGVVYGETALPETGEFIGEVAVEINTGRIIKPLDENEAVVV